MTPDDQLLRRYAQDGDEAAFAELVRRYVDMVYSAALRLTFGDAPLAQDVSQSVFTDLARKAWQLSGRTTVSGWLHTSVRYAAAKARRGETRRRAREQEAFAMQEPTTKPEFDWSQLQPLLDEAVGQLREGDRDIVTLRFFQNKSHGEIGAALGLNEDTARKRVDRALEKLREYFTRRGITVSAGLLAATMAANSVQAAPVDLVGDLAEASLSNASGAVADGIFVKILLMNTKTKLILAVSIIGTILGLFTLSWSQSRPVVTAKAATSATSAQAVALPTSLVVAASSSSGTIAPPATSGEGNTASIVSTTNVRSSGHIRIPSEPKNGSTSVLANLEAYKTDSNYVPLPGPFGGAVALPPEIKNLKDVSSLKAMPLLNFYNVPAVDVADGGGLETAKDDGFVYSITATTGDVYLNAAVYVDASGTANGVRFIGGRSKFYDIIVLAMQQLETFDQVKKGSFEMRRLQVRARGYGGATFLDVFWLKADSGGKDLIYSYQTHPPLVEKHLYAVDDFLSLVRPYLELQVGRLPPQAVP